MNERIKQLAEQSGFETDCGPLLKPSPFIRMGGLCVGVPLEKFAELIINECVQACIEEGKTYEIESAGEYQSNLYVTAIKKYFGIDE